MPPPGYIVDPNNPLAFIIDPNANGSSDTKPAGFFGGLTGGLSSAFDKAGNFLKTDAGKLVAGGLGGLLGLAGGSGQTQGSQGYSEGIPEYTAQRELVPGVFDPTGRRPGEAGRRYFTDTQYVPKTDATGIQTVMGGDYLANLNAEALARQQSGTAQNNALLQLMLAQQMGDSVSNFDPLVNISDPTGGKLADPNYIPQLGDIISGNEFVDTTQSVGTREDGTTYVKTDAVGAGQIPLGLERGIVGKDSIYDPARIATQQIYEGIRGKWGDMNKAGAKQELAKFINGKTTPEAFATAMNMPLADVQAILSDAQTANTPPPLVEYSSAPSGVKPSLNPFTRKPQTNSDGAVLGDDGKYYNADSFAQGGRVGMYNQGGLASFLNRPRGYYLGGATDGMADRVPATIDGAEPARLSDGEFVIPADVVGHLGNGNSDAGAKNLYAMMDRLREDRTGTTRQGKQINPNNYLMG
jgi:hypothetical protein